MRPDDVKPVRVIVCRGHTKICSVDSTTALVENAALNKPATQSSTYYGWTASKAVDGDKNPKIGDGSCMHTFWQDGMPYYEWWMVDLEREYKIESISITNRLNKADRLYGFDIFVSLNSTFEEDDHMTDESLCYHVLGPLGSAETRTLTCQSPMFGQYVQIYMEMPTIRSMHFCEVEVTGYPATCYIEYITASLSAITNTESSSTTTTPTSASTSTATPNPSNTRTKIGTTEPASTSTATPRPQDTKLKTVTTASSSTSTATPSPQNTKPETVTTTSSSLMSTATPTPQNTTTKTTTSMTSLLQGNTSTTAPLTCSCVCDRPSNTKNLTQEELMELVKQLTKELTVNKKETSLSKRKLISVGDERQSSQTIGFIGVLALCVPVLLIVSFDLMNLWSFVEHKRSRVIPKR